MRKFVPVFLLALAAAQGLQAENVSDTGIVDIPPAEWRDMALGRTLIYTIEGDFFALERYAQSGNRVELQLSSGECLSGTWSPRGHGVLLRLGRCDTGLFSPHLAGRQSGHNPARKRRRNEPHTSYDRHNRHTSHLSRQYELNRTMRMLSAAILVALVSATPLNAEDIPPEEWSKLVRGRTVVYTLEGQFWGFERYAETGNRVEFQFPDGTCNFGTWSWVDGAYCFAWAGREPDCYHHRMSAGQITVVGADPGTDPGSVYEVTNIVDMALLCSAPMS